MAAATVSTANVLITAVEHPLRSPNYRLWLIGGTISLLGDQFYLVALPWLVLQQTGSAVVMGAIMMAGAIPRALLMLMGGAVSDRMSARKIMIATAMARTICVTVIAVLVWLRVLRTWELYALAVAFGVADAFAVPAQTAYMPSLLKREQLVAADRHHCWSSSSRVCDQDAGRRMGLLRGCDQLLVYHWRIVEAAGPT